MPGIFVYESTCRDFSTTGMVGELTPTECYFEEEKNGASGLSLRMYYDRDERWKALKAGNYIKAEVPVRIPPALVDGEYSTQAEQIELHALDLQQFAVRLNLQQHAYVFQPLYADKECTVVASTVQPGVTYSLWSDGSVTVRPKKLVGTEGNKPKRGYVPQTKTTVLSTREIPARFTGLEAVTMPTRLFDQYFVIDSVVQNDDYVEVTANHVWYQLLKNYTTYKPEANQSVSGYDACKEIMEHAISPVSMWSVESDIDTQLKGLDYNQKNLVEAFLDPKNGICAKYNAVLLRDNWDFYVIKESNVGYDRGFIVEYGQNLLSIENKENLENVTTRVVPFGKTQKGEPVYMTGTRWVDSDHIDEYADPMVELLDCSATCTIGKDGTTEQNITSKLRAEAEKRFTEDKADIPEIEITIDFLSLGDTEEYAQYRDLDKVYLYDKITVKDKKRGFTYAAEVTYTKHNVLTGKLEQIKIGSVENSDGKRKIATWQVPSVNGENIRLKTIQAGTMADGSVSTEALMDGAVTGLKIQDATITNAKIQDATITNAKIEDATITKAKMGEASIGNAQIESAGIEFAKIKELNAESAYFGQSIFEEAVGGKLYVPRLLFDAAQGRQMMVKDMVIGASNGKYYRLDISETDDGISMVPTELTVSASEIAAGHTNDGKPIIATTATVQDLSAEHIYSIDALINRITAKRINVDELFASNAFIGKLNTTDIRGNESLRIYVDNATIGAITESTARSSVDATTKANAARDAAIAVANSKYAIQTGIEILPAGINLSGNKYIRMQTSGQTNMELSAAGINMETAGTFKVRAQDQKGSIIFGTNESNATFAVNDQGNMHVKSVITDSISVNGFTLPGFVVSESQPSGHGLLWIKPSSATEKSWVHTPASRGLDQVGGTLGRYRDYTISYAASDYLAGNLFYGIIATLYVYSSSAVGNRYNFKAILNPGNQNITIGQTSGQIYTAGTSIKLDLMMTAISQNIMSTAGGSFTLRLETDCNQNYCRLDGTITMKAKSQSSSGVAACSVFYLS